MSDPTTPIELTDDEAIVLLDWLARFNASGNSAFEDQSEQRALWNLEAVLERSIPAVLDPSYAELLAEARDRIRDPDE